MNKNPVLHIPPLIKYMLIIYIGAFALIKILPEFFISPDSMLTFIQYFIFFPSLYQGDFFLEPHFLQMLLTPFTYSLYHVSFTHLLWNMAFLVVFGTPLSRLLPLSSFLTIYLLATVGPAFSHAVFFDSPIGGASGAVSGLIGFLCALPCLKNNQRIEIPSIFKDKTKSLLFAFIYLFLNLVLVVLSLANQRLVTIAGDAHISGFIIGFICAYIFQDKIRQKHSIFA